jgi:hypothetical protein
MEHLTAGAILKDKIAGIATDLITKLDSAVQSIGQNNPTLDNPITYKVVHRGGALVRSGYETNTPQVHQLSAGETVTVVERVGRRVRIISPVEGWVSTETKDNVQIMKPTAVNRSHTDEAFEHHFESKFNRIKAIHRREHGIDGLFEEDPRTRQRSPTDSPRYRTREREYDDRKREDFEHSSRSNEHSSSGSKANMSKPSAAESSSVPKLAAPGSRTGPSVASAAGTNLSDIDLISCDAPATSAAAAPSPADLMVDFFGTATGSSSIPAAEQWMPTDDSFDVFQSGCRSSTQVSFPIGNQMPLANMAFGTTPAPMMGFAQLGSGGSMGCNGAGMNGCMGTSGCPSMLMGGCQAMSCGIGCGVAANMGRGLAGNMGCGGMPGMTAAGCSFSCGMTPGMGCGPTAFNVATNNFSTTNAVAGSGLGMGTAACSGTSFGGMQGPSGYGGMSLPTTQHASGSWNAFQQPQPVQAQPAVAGSTSGSSSVDELMSKTIAGVSKLSLETRIANQRR